MSALDLLLIVMIGGMLLVLALKAIQKPALALGLLLLCLPTFSFARRLFPETGVLFPSFETIAVLLIGGGVQLRNLKAKAPDRTIAPRDTVALLIFLASGLVSSIAARDPVLSLKILLAGGVVPCLCYVIAARYLKTLTDLTYVVSGLFGVAVQVGIYVALRLGSFQSLALYADSDNMELYQRMYTEDPAVKLFLVPSVTVSVVVAAIPFVAWYLRYRKQQRLLVGGVVGISVVLTALMSLSRGSWIGTGVALIGSLPLLFKRVRVSRIMLIIGLMSVIYLSDILYISAGVRNISDFLSTIILSRTQDSSFVEENRNVTIRRANYILALQSASKHVLIGVGLGQYTDIYQEFPDSEWASQIYWITFAHSLFLTLIPEIGLLGAVALLYLFLHHLFRGIRSYQRAHADDVSALAYAASVGVLAYTVIASTAGAHLVASVARDIGEPYFMAPALIVVCTLLGIISAATRKFGDNAQHRADMTALREQPPSRHKPDQESQPRQNTRWKVKGG